MVDFAGWDMPIQYSSILDEHKAVRTAVLPNGLKSYVRQNSRPAKRVALRLAVKAGYQVDIATSGDPEDIALITELVIPGAQQRWASDAVADADIVVLAIPLHRFLGLDPALLSGKLVVDAMSYWPASDGILEPFEGRVSSEVVARRLSGSAVVKALNQGTKDTIAAPQKALDVLKARDPMMKPDIEKVRLDIALGLTNTAHVAKNGLSSVTSDKLKRTIDAIVTAYQLPTTPDPATVYTEKFLPPVADRMPPKAAN